MWKSIKNLGKQSAVYGIGHILSRSIGFLLLPIHTKNLDPAQYGVVSLLFSTLAILNVVFSYGMDAAFLRFFIFERRREGRRDLFSTAHWMIFCSSILFSAVLFVFPSVFANLIFRESDYGRLVRMASGIVFADAIALLPFLVLRAEEKAVSFVLLRSAGIGVTLGLNILYVVFLKRGVEGVFLSNLIASAFTVLTVLPIFVRWLRPRFDRGRLAEMLRFGLPYVPAGLAMVIMDQINRFFVDRMLGKEATGLFSAGYKIGMIMSLAVAAFRFAWHPFFLSTARQKEAKAIFARVLTYFTLAAGILFLLVSGWTKEIMAIRIMGFALCDAAFVGGASVVPIVLCSYAAYGWYVNFMVAVYLKKKTVHLPWVTGAGALVAVACNALFIPVWGLSGAAWATFLGYAVMAFLLHRITQTWYPIPYEWTRIGKLVLVFAAFFLLLSAVQSEWGKWLILAGLPGSLFLIRFFNESEKAFIRRRWKKA